MLNFVRPYNVRLLIVLAWIALFIGTLYLPGLAPVFKPKSINVFGWSGMFDPQAIAAFEQKTGIRVNVSYYETNEELLVKLRATGGRGYDLIVPSDYAVALLRRENLLKPLNSSKLSFIKHINPLLLGHYYDPSNTYSLPLEWAVFGLGIDTRVITSPTWSTVFAPSTLKLIMSNDPFVALPLAALYLYNNPHALNHTQLQKIKQLLRTQRSRVVAYADFRADALLASGTAPLALGSSSYIARGMREHNFIDFTIPNQGTLITIENVALPVTTQKDDLVYQFLEFIYEPTTLLNHFATTPFLPATTHVLDNLPLPPSLRDLLNLTPERMKKFFFFKITELPVGVSEKEIYNTWVEIKS